MDVMWITKVSAYMSDTEATELGNIVIEKLDLLISALNDAKRKGKYDVWMDNVILTWSKRKDVRRAEELAKDARSSLGSFREALQEHSLELNTKEFLDDTKTIDYFLGIYGNWNVQKKIESNLEEAEKAKTAVLHCMQLLSAPDSVVSDTSPESA